jgi:hypothetical protein
LPATLKSANPFPPTFSSIAGLLALFGCERGSGLVVSVGHTCCSLRGVLMVLTAVNLVRGLMLVVVWAMRVPKRCRVARRRVLVAAFIL